MTFSVDDGATSVLLELWNENTFEDEIIGSCTLAMGELEAELKTKKKERGGEDGAKHAQLIWRKTVRLDTGGEVELEVGFEGRRLSEVKKEQEKAAAKAAEKKKAEEKAAKQAAKELKAAEKAAAAEAGEGGGSDGGKEEGSDDDDKDGSGSGSDDNSSSKKGKGKGPVAKPKLQGPVEGRGVTEVTVLRAEGIAEMSTLTAQTVFAKLVLGKGGGKEVRTKVQYIIHHAPYTIHTNQGSAHQGTVHSMHHTLSTLIKEVRTKEAADAGPTPQWTSAMDNRCVVV
jgi:hypothetical protein